VPGAKQTAKPRGARRWEHELDVIGLRFRWKRDARRALSDLIEHRGAIKGIRLEREPDNRADANAVMVLLPMRIQQGRQLGYLRAPAAELLAPRLDAGTLQVVKAELLDLDAADDYNTGTLRILFKDVPSLG